MSRHATNPAVSRLRIEAIRKVVMASPYSWGDPPSLIQLPNSATPLPNNPWASTSNIAGSPANRTMSWKDWTLEALLSRGFEEVDRIAANSPNLLDVIREHEESGEPVIIEGLHKERQWDADLFSLEKFQALSLNDGGVFSFYSLARSNYFYQTSKFATSAIEPIGRSRSPS
jgi:hypothetical protein